MTETKTNFQILNELITNHIMTILNEEMSGWNRIHLYPPLSNIFKPLLTA